MLQGAVLFSHWRRIGNDQKLLWLGIFGAVMLLILKQPNLSTAALMGLLLWLMALAGGVPLVLREPLLCGLGVVALWVLTRLFRRVVPVPPPPPHRRP